MRTEQHPTTIRRARILAGGVAVAALVAFAGAGGAAWAGGSQSADVYVSGPGSDSLGGTWGFDNSGSPVVTFDATVAGGASSLSLQTPTDSDGVRVLDTLASPVTGATGVHTLLDGASFSYQGSPVNLQLSTIYVPVDPAEYGVDGTTAPCANAGVVFPGTSTEACWTVLKYLPIASSSGTRTVSIGDAAGDSATSTDGWLSTKQVGEYPGTGPLIGQTLTDYLAQMADVEVAQVGISLGTGAGGQSAHVLDTSFGGETYHFGAAPTSTPTPTPTPTSTPTPSSTPSSTPTAEVSPPAPNSAALPQILASAGVDVAADTAAFQAPEGVSLSAVDASTPFSGSLPWHSSDSSVEVFAYSTPLDLGRAPVVGGHVVLTGLDLTALAAGSHHLVFVGETSGALEAIAFTVADPATTPTLAATGTTVPMPILLAAIGAVLAGAALVMWRRARLAS